MAVPGTRPADWEFAAEFGLPVLEVIAGGDVSQEAYTGDGVCVNSDYLNGLDVSEAKKAITARLRLTAVGAAGSSTNCGTGFSRVNVIGVSLPHRLRRRRAPAPIA